MDNAERKILMLKRVTKRHQQTIKAQHDAIMKEQDTVKKLQDRCKMLMERLKGNPTSVGVPEGMAASYEYAIKFASDFKYQDGTILSIWKDPSNYKKPALQLINQPIIDWAVIKLGPDMYDAEFKQEWNYGVNV